MDAELIYWALLRAEKRLELPPGTHAVDTKLMQHLGAFKAIQTLREELGNVMANRGAIPHLSTSPID